jgi:hypothetical protein
MIIASLNLLNDGTVEFAEADNPGHSKALDDLIDANLNAANRLFMVSHHWNNPELQALLDTFIEDDKGVPLE